MDWKEVAVQMILPMVKSVAEAQLKELVDKLDAKEGDADFANDMKAAYNLFKRLESSALDSKTKIDDTVVAIFIDVIEQKAAELNIPLT